MEGQDFDRLSEWLALKDTSPPVEDQVRCLGGLQLLVQRNRPKHVTGVSDKIPWRDKKTFKAVCEKMKVPLMYVPLLQYCSGLVKISITRETDRSGPRLEFVGHAVNYHADTWSLAFTYTPETGITSGIFSADAKLKASSILEHVRASAHMAHHPMLLPVILFRVLLESNIGHRAKLHHDIYEIERELGYLDSWNHPEPHDVPPFSYPVSEKREAETSTSEKIQNARVTVGEDEVGQNPEDFYDMNRRLNACKKQVSARCARQWFWKRFRDVLFQGLRAVKQLTVDDPATRLTGAQAELDYWISLESAEFESLDGRDVHYKARIETQLSVVRAPSLIFTPPVLSCSLTAPNQVYSLITQRDSRYQASIAAAAKKDGEDMKFFAYLGSFFLPANFIAVSTHNDSAVAYASSLFGKFISRRTRSDVGRPCSRSKSFSSSTTLVRCLAHLLELPCH